VLTASGRRMFLRTIFAPARASQLMHAHFYTSITTQGATAMGAKSPALAAAAAATAAAQQESVVTFFWRYARARGWVG